MSHSAAAFRAKYGPWAVVAGASQGLGEEYARQLAAFGITWYWSLGGSNP